MLDLVELSFSNYLVLLDIFFTLINRLTLYVWNKKYGIVTVYQLVKLVNFEIFVCKLSKLKHNDKK